MSPLDPPLVRIVVSAWDHPTLSVSAYGLTDTASGHVGIAIQGDRCGIPSGNAHLGVKDSQSWVLTAADYSSALASLKWWTQVNSISDAALVIQLLALVEEIGRRWPTQPR